MNPHCGLILQRGMAESDMAETPESILCRASSLSASATCPAVHSMAMPLPRPTQIQEESIWFWTQWSPRSPCILLSVWNMGSAGPGHLVGSRDEPSLSHWTWHQAGETWALFRTGQLLLSEASIGLCLTGCWLAFHLVYFKYFKNLSLKSLFIYFKSPSFKSVFLL